MKTFSILVIDGRSGFGNGRVLPAGPLREPVSAAAARCHAALLIGADLKQATACLPSTLPVLRASLKQDQSIAELSGRAVVAFAGIASPGKFFDPLCQAGANLVVTRPFPDHHPYPARELRDLLHEATVRHAILVTTPKDAVRLPGSVRSKVTVIGVHLEWQQPDQIDQILDSIIAPTPPFMP